MVVVLGAELDAGDVAQADDAGVGLSGGRRSFPRAAAPLHVGVRMAIG